jgi:triosephosphate isomerase (TIM)
MTPGGAPVRRQPIAVGNWKMHRTVDESTAAVRELLELLGAVRDIEVAVAPSYTALRAVGEVLRGTEIRLAAQNAHWEESGAFTGEVSAAQLKDAGCRLVLIGHSERRHIFGESDEMVKRKLAGVLKQGLDVVLCVGETLEQRLEGRTSAVVQAQMREGLGDPGGKISGRILMAYEPVWAIGTGQVATAEQISEVLGMIRREFEKRFGSAPAESVRILYGGSVTPDNIAELSGVGELDGVLVGGASLSAPRFTSIIKGLGKGKA